MQDLYHQQYLCNPACECQTETLMQNLKNFELIHDCSRIKTVAQTVAWQQDNGHATSTRGNDNDINHSQRSRLANVP